MGPVKFKTLLFVSGIASIAATIIANSAVAGQIADVCIAKKKDGLSIMIAGYSGYYSTIQSTLEQGYCYHVTSSPSRDAAAKAEAEKKGNIWNSAIYTRGEKFTLPGVNIDEIFDRKQFYELKRCLSHCPKSASIGDLQAINSLYNAVDANARAGAGAPNTKLNSAGGPAGGGTESGAGIIGLAAVKAVSETSTNTAAPKTDQQRQAELVAAYEKENGTYTGNDDGGRYRLSTRDGDTVKVYTDGPNKGQTRSLTGGLISSNSDYFEANGTSHPTREKWAAAMRGEGGNGSGTVTYPNGTRVEYENNVPVRKYDADGKLVATYNPNAAKLDKIDACEKSQAIDPTFVCDATYGIAKAADIGNQVLTGAGRMVVTQMGAAASQKAVNGKMSGSLDAAAKMAKTSFTYETGLTVANIAAAAALNKKAKNHSANIAKLSDGAQQQAADENHSPLDANGNPMARGDYRGALVEQRDARNTAREGAFKATMVGMQSLAGAIVAKKTQKDAERNARDFKKLENQLAAQNFQYDPNQLAPPGTGGEFDPNLLAATDGSGQGNLTTSDGTDPNAPTGPMLGEGNDLGAGDSTVGAPKAGGFKAGSVAGGAGGGGGGAAGAGGGAAGGGGPGAQEESKAAYASEFGTKERYESGGGAAGGAKGAGGKGKDDVGIDLNGLLAQFLPKSEEDLGAKNGILDSIGFGGGRNLANEEPASYLDKNADLFQRIHETMSEKNRKGQLGI